MACYSPASSPPASPLSPSGSHSHGWSQVRPGSWWQKNLSSSSSCRKVQGLSTARQLPQLSHVTHMMASCSHHAAPRMHALHALCRAVPGLLLGLECGVHTRTGTPVHAHADGGACLPACQPAWMGPRMRIRRMRRHATHPQLVRRRRHARRVRLQARLQTRLCTHKRRRLATWRGWSSQAGAAAVQSCWVEPLRMLHCTQARS